MSDQLVFVRSRESRIHLAVRHDGAMLTNERCNLDDLDHATREILEVLPPDLGPEPLCRRCFPDVVQGQGDSVTVA